MPIRCSYPVKDTNTPGINVSLPVVASERGYFHCEPPLPREDSLASLKSNTDHLPMLKRSESLEML